MEAEEITSIELVLGLESKILSESNDQNQI